MTIPKQIGRPFTETVGSVPKSPFVQGWDAAAGLTQAMNRTRDRTAMGRKMTPIGNGTMKRK